MNLDNEIETLKNTPEGKQTLHACDKFGKVGGVSDEKQAEEIFKNYLQKLTPKNIYFPINFCVNFPQMMIGKVPVPDCMKNRVFFSGRNIQIDICNPSMGRSVTNAVVDTILPPDLSQYMR